MINRRNVINCLVVLSCLVSSIICIEFNNEQIYRYCFLFPIPFIFIYITYFIPCFREKMTPFKIFFCILLYIRYVILPVGYSIYGYTGFSKNMGDISHYQIASFIVIFELLILNIFLIINSKAKTNKLEQRKTKEYKETNSNIVIYTFILIILFAFFINNSLWSSVYFIAPSEEVSQRFSRFNDSEQLLIYMFNIAKQFLCLVAIDKLAKKYNAKNNNIYCILALLFVMLNIIVYTGTNRAEFVITIICTCYLTIELFPKLKKIIVVGGVIASIVVVPMISNFRKANLTNDDFSGKDLVSLGNIYMAGIDNVALSIRTSEDYLQYKTIHNFAYDMTRGIMGIGIFIKNTESNVLTGRLFNYSFFGNYSKNTSQIMPMCGQGFYYFNVYGFYIIEIFFAYILLKIEKKFYTVKDIKLKYFLFIILMRLAMMQCLNGTILFNRLSYELVLPIILIKINGLISVKKGIATHENEFSQKLYL